jgi:DNA-binding transcriptional LysR family regulator
MDTLDVKQMKLLLALLEEKNLTRVANKLSVSQQAVSEQLKKLRLTFSDRLFVRAKHGVVPTPFAENLGLVVRDVLEKLEQARRPDAFSLSNVNQTYVISASDYAQKVLLVDLFKVIRPKSPGLKLIIKDLEIDNMERSLLDGSVNLIIATPTGLPASLPSARLMSETFTCVVAASTPEESRGFAVESSPQRLCRCVVF